MLGQWVGLEPSNQDLELGGLQMMTGASNHHRNEDGMGTSQRQSTHHIVGHHRLLVLLHVSAGTRPSWVVGGPRSMSVAEASQVSSPQDIWGYSILKKGDCYK